jgi:plasmid maintenance system antidote protein VapI
VGTIRDYLLAGIEKAGSGNKLASALKTTGANITRIKDGAGFPGDETIIRLADYLGENREKLLLINQTERAPESARPEWKELLKRFAGAAALLLVLSLTGSAFAATYPQGESGENIHYRTLLRDALRKLLNFHADLSDTLRGIFLREAFGVQN